MTTSIGFPPLSPAPEHSGYPARSTRAQTALSRPSYAECVRARILVVDDDRKLREMLRRALEGAGFEVVTAEDGGRALAAVAARAPDAIVLDVLMPGVDGLGVARRLRERGDFVPILMLTARDAVPDRVAGLEAGADDYLVKPFALDELIARVRAMLRRRGETELLRFADLEMDTRTREVRRKGRVIELTAKEFELLEFFLREPRRVHEREHILDSVWGYESEANSNVLEVYVGYLRRKLGEPSLIRTVRGVGYGMQER